MTDLAVIIAAGLFFFIGLKFSDLEDKVEELLNKPDKPRAGVTNPYHQPTPKAAEPGATSGIVQPKSPQLLQFEADERMRKDAAERWGIKPK